MKVNLETDSPQGRLDVLAYKLAERLTKHIESSQGLSGIWDNIKPHVHEIVEKNVSGIKLPGEIKVLMEILQANQEKILGGRK